MMNDSILYPFVLNKELWEEGGDDDVFSYSIKLKRWSDGGELSVTIPRSIALPEGEYFEYGWRILFAMALSDNELVIAVDEYTDLIGLDVPRFFSIVFEDGPSLSGEPVVSEMPFDVPVETHMDKFPLSTWDDLLTLPDGVGFFARTPKDEDDKSSLGVSILSWWVDKSIRGIRTSTIGSVGQPSAVL